MSSTLETIRKDIEVRISAYNEALAKNDFARMNALENEIKECEKMYAEESMHEVIAGCRKTKDPMLEAIRVYSYGVLSHQIVREDGAVTGMKLVDDRTKQLDLLKLCNILGANHLWEYKIERFGNLLCMRAATELGLQDWQIKRIERLYYYHNIIQKEELGAIPTSNTQICKLLQEVIDSILFTAGDTGKNIYRCNNHDVAYLLMCYTKRNGKKKLTVEVAKTAYVRRIVMDVMHRIVIGGVYDLKYQMIKEKDVLKTTEAKPAHAAEVSETEKIPESETVILDRPSEGSTKE